MFYFVSLWFRWLPKRAPSNWRDREMLDLRFQWFDWIPNPNIQWLEQIWIDALPMSINDYCNQNSKSPNCWHLWNSVMSNFECRHAPSMIARLASKQMYRSVVLLGLICQMLSAKCVWPTGENRTACQPSMLCCHRYSWKYMIMTAFCERDCILSRMNQSNPGRLWSSTG